jgi:aspartyl-tRNA synthetase
MRRTHHCNQLSIQDKDKTVSLIGWIDAIRNHGGVLFVDLRDREGKTQVVFDPHKPLFKELIQVLKPESVIEVTGKVRPRLSETVNAKVATGAIEIEAQSITIHNIAQTLPFPLEEEKADKVSEDLRLSYRYLDLRRPKNQERLRARHKVLQCVHHFLDEEGFTQVELPYLFKSTPEGAREFLVPSRLNPGAFYALSQSPQQYKQMLMVAGLERYYSIARCFRDEDLRADRQPEFTQIDLEASFIDREDIYKLVESLLSKIWKKVLNHDLPLPFPRMPYKDAMNSYGVDKPDTRFGLEIQDLSSVFQASAFKVFAGVIQEGGCIKAFNAKGLADISQGEIKALETIAKELGAKGLAFIKKEGGELKSPILKFLSEKELAAIELKLKLEEGDLVFFAANSWDKACAILGRIRLEAAQLLVKRHKLVLSNTDYKFLWVTDFPLMVYDDEAKRFVSAHHPFTAPVEEDAKKLYTDPEAVRGQHYDIVLNGVELGGGSIRIHQPALQRKVFEDVLKLPKDVVDSRFGYMLKAFEYGAPPHGGIALGLDRLCAMLCGVTSIREVLAFPKNQKGQEPMSSTPSAVNPKQLKDLHIALE